MEIFDTEGNPIDPTPGVINATASGDTKLVDGVEGKIIRVYRYNIMATVAVTVTFKSGGTTVISGPKPCGANGGIAVGDSEWGYFDTAPGEDLNINLSGSATVGGEFLYAVI